MKNTKISIPKDCTGITLQFDFEDRGLKSLVKDDAYIKTEDNHIFYGVYDELLEKELLSKVFICSDKTIETNYFHSKSGSYSKISNAEFNAELSKQGKTWNFKNSKLENLDEFSNLPKKIDDLEIILGSYIDPNDNNICEKDIFSDTSNDATFPTKYAKAIQIQPALLQMYEAWSDKVSFNFNNKVINKFCIILINNTLTVSVSIDKNKVFSFATKKKAEKFLELFRKELELYKPLMGYNGIIENQSTTNIDADRVLPTVFLNCKECKHFDIEIINKDGDTYKICKAKPNDYRAIIDMHPSQCDDYVYSWGRQMLSIINRQRLFGSNK